ncbi:MAG: hypothetical protein WKG07_14545 [Hymenobacter sp.]
MISHFVLQNSGSEDDARDVYQEGVMVFYEKVCEGSLELSCQIKTYLYAVCRRLWLKRLTSKSRLHGVRLLDEEEYGPYLNTGAEDDVQEAEERDRRFATMSEALTHLGEPCRSLPRRLLPARKIHARPHRRARLHQRRHRQNPEVQVPDAPEKVIFCQL